MIDKIKKLNSLMDELEKTRLLEVKNDGCGNVMDLYDAVESFALARDHLNAAINKLIIYYGYKPK